MQCGGHCVWRTDCCKVQYPIYSTKYFSSSPGKTTASTCTCISMNKCVGTVRFLLPGQAIAGAGEIGNGGKLNFSAYIHVRTVYLMLAQC